MKAAPLCLAVILAGLGPEGKAPAGTRAWVGATLIDGTGGPAVENATIVVAGERITAAGPRGRVAIPEGAPRVDVAGKWIVPGLVDSRVSLSRSGSLFSRPDLVNLEDSVPLADEIAATRRRFDGSLARFLACGVTTIVDSGGPLWTFECRERAARLPAAPRVATAGPVASARWAPPALVAGEEDDPPIIAFDTPESARDFVRRLLTREPDLVQVEFPYWPENDVGDYEPIVRAAIDAAHEGGRRAAVRVRYLVTARAAVLAGADAILHGPEDAPLDDSLLAEMKRRGVVYATSFLSFEAFSEVVRQEIALSEPEKRFGDPEVIRSWDEVRKLPADHFPDPDFFPDIDPSPMLAQNLRRARDAGLTLAAGSTAGNIGVLLGPSIHREFELLVRAGLTPGEVLLAATRGGAALLGRSADLGTLAPGKLADFLVLDADPLKDVANLARISSVVKGGAALDPAALVPPPPR